MNSADREMIASLSDLVKQVLQGQKGIVMEAIPLSEVPEMNELRSAISTLISQHNQSYNFILDLAKGKLDTPAPPLNSFVSPFKQLQADLKHLTWQIRQISEGDLEQNVSFSGDFSESINKMIDALREKQRISELNEHYLDVLKELNASKDKLFSIIAHDLKNPFSGLINLSDLVLEEVRLGRYENIEEYALLLKSFSNQGYKLLINLLDWARVQSNTMLVKLEPIRLTDMVDMSKELIEPLALQKNIALHFRFDEDALLLADSNMLQTILRNLLGNAVKFTPHGGTITLSAERVGDAIRICVQDNGVGIRPDNLKKLFRIDSPFSTQGTSNEFGSGLGLIICRDFLKKMNSELLVESQVALGSTFSFVLPLA